LKIVHTHRKKERKKKVQLKIKKNSTMSDDGDADSQTIGDADVNHLQFWQLCDDNPVLQLPVEPGQRYVIDARGALLVTLARFGLVAFVEPSQRAVFIAPLVDLLAESENSDFATKTRRAKRLRLDAAVAAVALAASPDACVLAILTNDAKVLLCDVRRAWHHAGDDAFAAAIFHTVEHVSGVKSVAFAPTLAELPHVHCLAMCCGKSLAFVTVDSRSGKTGEMSSFGSSGVPPAALCWRDVPRVVAAGNALAAAVALHDGSVGVLSVVIDAAAPLAKPKIKVDKRIMPPHSLPSGSPAASLSWPAADHLVVGYKTKPIEEEDDPLPYYVIDPRDESPTSLATVLIRLEHDQERPPIPLAVSLDAWRFFVLADTAASIISTVGINTLSEEPADAPLLLFPSSRSSCRWSKTKRCTRSVSRSTLWSVSHARRSSMAAPRTRPTFAGLLCWCSPAPPQFSPMLCATTPRMACSHG
jgi:hypothetical protein